MLHGALGAKCCEWMMRKVKGRGRRGSGREGFSAHEELTHIRPLHHLIAFNKCVI